MVIEGNIILNGVGAPEGTTSSAKLANGIYLDDNAANINVINNTVAYAGKAGIYLHNSHDIFLKNNTLFNNATQLIAQKDAASKGLVRDNTILDNIFFTNNTSQFAASFLSIGNDISEFGKIDSNYYSSPSGEDVTISTSYVDNALKKTNKLYNLEGWRSSYKKDVSSERVPLKLNASGIKINSQNKVSNGTFSNDISGIKATQCKIEWQNYGLDGGCLKVSSLPDFPSSYITIPVGAIHSGGSYILNFSLKGAEDSDKTISVFLRSKGAPYTVLSSKVHRIIPKERHDFEITFSDVKEHPDALLVFSLNDPNSIYLMDNVKLYEANKTAINPDQQILFEYNPSVSVKKVPLNGTYIDLKNRSYAKSLTLQPYTSAVLIKQN